SALPFLEWAGSRIGGGRKQRTHEIRHGTDIQPVTARISDGAGAAEGRGDLLRLRPVEVQERFLWPPIGPGLSDDFMRAFCAAEFCASPVKKGADAVHLAERQGLD